MLKRINYTYVPATKSNEYFMRLLSTLYESISINAESEINKKTDDYSLAIQIFTNRISEIVKTSTGINSALTMPPSQIDIFKLFTFNTKDPLNNDIFLEQRGDGIKARHIPAILKFISEYSEKFYNKKGAVPVTTIWGYEEPETGIELSRCFDFSREFSNYSKDIQMFLTTHSPAFYSLEGNERTVIQYIYKDINSGETLSQKDLKQTDIHEKIGLMPLITPYIVEKENELKKLKGELNDERFIDIPTLFIEGKHDREVLEYIISKKFPSFYKALENKELRIFTFNNGAGTSRMIEWVKAWTYIGFKSKVYFLFDKDEAGIKAKNEVDEYLKDNKSSQIKSQFIKPSSTIKEKILKYFGCFLYEMEHLYSIEFWNLLKDNGLIKQRSIPELTKMLSGEMTNIRDSPYAIAEEKIIDIDVREKIFLSEPRNKKEVFEKACSEYESNPQSSIFDGFEPTIKDIAKYFNLDT